MPALFSIIIGYAIGALSPAALVGKIKNVDLKNSGTRNLGASNTLIHFGKLYGALVMMIDIVKSYISVKIAEFLFPALSISGLLAGGASVVGHIYPFYLRFKGGKGLASFGGMVLALDPFLFLVLLIISFSLMIIVNYGVAMPMSACVMFPFMYFARHNDPVAFLIVLSVSLLVVIKHLPNLKKAIQKEDMTVREIIKK